MTQPPEPFFGRSQARDANGSGVNPARGVLEAIRSVWPVQRWGGVRVVIGVSGGADSVALACAMCEIANSVPVDSTAGSATAVKSASGGSAALDSDSSPCSQPEPCSRPATGDLVFAHFNHGLRGADSDADERFVGELADRLRCDFVVSRQALASSGKRIKDEATLSAIRREFLVKTARRLGARYIALAHHQDDNIETFIHHLLRGTGPAGLCGMPSFRNLHEDLVMARPLLAITREDLREYLSTIGQSFRDDVTNHENGYTRNWIRNTLLPNAQERFPNAGESLSRVMNTLTQWRELLDRLAGEWLQANLVSSRPITLRRDNTGDPAVIVAALQRLWDQHGFPRGEMTQSHWNDVASCILGTRDGCSMLPGAIQIVMEDDCVLATR